MNKLRILPPREDQRGAVAIIVGVFLLLAGIGFAALAIDISHIHVVRNELQNAADAGALRGARVLLNSNGDIDEYANQAAYDAATANKSFKNPVELYSPTDNDMDNWDFGAGRPVPDANIDVINDAEDVLRGHWSFNTSTFTPNGNTSQSNLFDKTPDQLDADLDFINAIWVRTRRFANPSSPSWFGWILGWLQYRQSAEAVAYRGFPGDFPENAFDQPIAICGRAIRFATGEVSCNIGRMLNSSHDPTVNNTGGWTNYTQDPCETANPPSVSPYICGNADVPATVGHIGLGATGGVVDNIFRDLRDCWLAPGQRNVLEYDEFGNPSIVDVLDQWKLDETGSRVEGTDGIPDRAWHLRLPVVDCGDSNNVPNCPDLIGGVDLSVIWIVRDLNITESDLSSEGVVINLVPDIMQHPLSKEWFIRDPALDDDAAWDAFAEFFDLENQGDATQQPPIPITQAPLQKKAIYFMPLCSAGPPVGGPGGEFFGLVSEIPKLVQ